MCWTGSARRRRATTNTSPSRPRRSRRDRARPRRRFPPAITGRRFASATRSASRASCSARSRWPMRRRARGRSRSARRTSRSRGPRRARSGSATCRPCRCATAPISWRSRSGSKATRTASAAASRRRLTPAHRHLYLLGAHVGAHTVKVESSGGKLALAPAALVRRHATLAGIAPAIWQPLAADPGRASPAEVVQRHRAALGALDADLAARDARSPATSSSVTPR